MESPLRPPPGAAHRLGTALFVALMILTCLVAAVATALYLAGAYLTVGAPTPFVP